MNLPSRFGAGLIFSTALTFGLGVTMAALIRTDFIPVKKAEAATFDINPVVEDEPVIVRTQKLKKLKVVTPPPPPKIDIQEAAKPTIAIATVDGAIPIFEKPVLGGTDFRIVINDKEATPIIRIPPMMPSRAEKSGHWKVRFDVSAEGQPHNIKTLYCTQRIFAQPSVKSVQKWKYSPKILDQIAVARSGVESNIRFNLTDENGQIIPE